ncbi:uncharacterized protein LOC120637638 [Pararge aegeria]|uniref:Jg23278 protein n=2 Tax=Pararge aegeria TaxID=116150 RepID=A0A8S4SMS4_9NEOP|nr:uncharacterized protein LOC120637638 [Pararge aegeria]CAH2268591.1 jg23278 [Pararge aegeria aegeria]
MENCEKESDAQKSFSSPPRRRRSTFFERRDSIVPQPEIIDPIQTENIDPNFYKKLNEVDNKHNQDLKRYHDILLAEKNQWKVEVKCRRNKYHDLRQQFQIASNAPSRSRISYSALSNEDIEFLKGKVNVSQLVENQCNLHKSVLRTRDFFRRATELDNVVLDHCEKKLSKVTDYILQNSTIDFK